MNDASSPRRWQICFTALRKSTIASAEPRPSIGLKLNSICPGPHSSSIDRGSRPMAESPSRSAVSVSLTESIRTSERYW